MTEEEKVLQRVVDELIDGPGVLVTRARRLRGQETFEPEPSLKVCLSGALARKDVEKAAMGLKAALIKVCGSESGAVMLRLRTIRS
jgi:serine palmitoyltransferase